MYFSASFAYTSILYFMPQLLASMSTPMAYAVILIQQACGIPGTLFGSKLVETKLGRKYTIVVSFSLSFLCCFLFYINQSPAAVSFRQIITCTSILNLVGMMGYSAIFTIVPESYMVDVRNLGIGLGGICARIGAIICPVFTGWLLSQNGGFEIALIIFAALFALTAASALPLKETRPAVGEKTENLRAGH
jgi:MFS family permease